jgi:D-arabinose 1-dehydrogenase-like Zn-dependent alcohol dehydrogenase
MLGFSARHRIVPAVEVAPMREVNAALERHAGNRVRYRTVLTTDPAPPRVVRSAPRR